jgi:hypothetical protein
MVRESVASVRTAGRTGSADCSFFREYTPTPALRRISRPHVRFSTADAGPPL